MTTSPWMANGQGSYDIPGYAALLMQRNRDTADAMSNIGRFAGAAGAGIIGAQQGAANPAPFGDGTTPDQGAAQAGLMNFSNAWGGNPGGGAATGMAGLVSGGNGGGVASSGGGGSVNFKQFAALGKAADGVRDAMVASTPTLPDQDPKVMGMTNDEWKHAGTADKVTALKAWQQAQTAKAQIQAYDLGQAHLAGALAQNSAAQKEAAALQKFSQGYSEATTPDPAALQAAALAGGPQGATDAASTVPQTINGRDIMAMAIKSGLNPKDAFEIAAAAQKASKADKEVAQNEDAPPVATEVNGMTIFHKPGSKEFVLDPRVSLEQKLAGQKDLIESKAGQKQNLTAKDLLASYQLELKTLNDPVTWAGSTPEQRAQHRAQIQSAIDALRGTPPGTVPPAASAAAPNEVIRKTSDGKAAVFDAKTKQFLRYAN